MKKLLCVAAFGAGMVVAASAQTAGGDVSPDPSVQSGSKADKSGSSTKGVTTDDTVYNPEQRPASGKVKEDSGKPNKEPKPKTTAGTPPNPPVLNNPSDPATTPKEPKSGSTPSTGTGNLPK